MIAMVMLPVILAVCGGRARFGGVEGVCLVDSDSFV
jgi:hypothetical protein